MRNAGVGGVGVYVCMCVCVHVCVCVVCVCVRACVHGCVDAHSYIDVIITLGGRGSEYFVQWVRVGETAS